MTDIDISNLNSNDPDHDIEVFWYSLKNAMANFYQSNKIPSRNINKWSKLLNLLKLDKKYEMIENNIRNYMSLYAIDIMKYDILNYHGNILNTNIKRWNKISKNNNFVISKNHNKILTLFDVYCYLKNKKILPDQQSENKTKKNNQINQINQVNQDKLLSKVIDELLIFFEDIELLVYFDTYSEMIKISLESNQPKVLNCIREIIGNDNFIIEINNYYPNLISDKNITSDKICKNWSALYKVNL
jgi:hypothetical protein